MEKKEKNCLVFWITLVVSIFHACAIMFYLATDLVLPIGIGETVTNEGVSMMLSSLTPLILFLILLLYAKCNSSMRKKLNIDLELSTNDSVAIFLWQIIVVSVTSLVFGFFAWRNEDSFVYITLGLKGLLLYTGFAISLNDLMKENMGQERQEGDKNKTIRRTIKDGMSGLKEGLRISVLSKSAFALVLVVEILLAIILANEMVQAMVSVGAVAISLVLVLICVFVRKRNNSK